jgi:crotonobetainyl-CoA:carnitine CoA-transferase CaiB-like acyl-CoA transferase
MQAQRTGEGAHADVSALDCLAGVMHVRVAQWDFDRKVEPRVGERKQLKSAPYSLFPCRDGYAGIFVVQDPQWEGLVRAMGSPDWATADLFKTHLGRAQHGVELLELLQSWTREHTMQEVFGACQANLVPACAVLTFRDVAKNPQYLERRAWQELQHPVLGPVPALRPPFLTPGVEWRPRRPAPSLGQHNREVLVDWLGCDASLAAPAAAVAQ